VSAFPGDPQSPNAAPAKFVVNAVPFKSVRHDVAQ
jgi:hypothetical protein